MFAREGFNMIDSFMNPQRGYEAAADEARKAWEEAQNYGRPYWQNGLDQTGRLTGAEDALLDPGALEAKWMQDYETSPYAKQLLEQNKNSGLDAASSMGLMGSSAALNNIQQGAGKIVNADRQQYINDLMQKYMTGIGIGQNIYGAGAGIGGDLMRGALSTGSDLGNAAYGAKNAPGQMFNNLLRAAMMAGGAF